MSGRCVAVCIAAVQVSSVCSTVPATTWRCLLRCSIRQPESAQLYLRSHRVCVSIYKEWCRRAAGETTPHAQRWHEQFDAEVRSKHRRLKSGEKRRYTAGGEIAGRTTQPAIRLQVKLTAEWDWIREHCPPACPRHHRSSSGSLRCAEIGWATFRVRNCLLYLSAGDLCCLIDHLRGGAR